MTAHTVPHSVGLNRPARRLPPLACDSHMHIFDPRFAPSPHWKRTPPDAPVAAYRRLQQRLGTQRTVVVTPSTYGTDNACTLDALDQLGDGARGVAVVAQGVGDAKLIGIGIHIASARALLRLPAGFVDRFAVVLVHAATPMRGARISRSLLRLRNKWLLMVPSARPVMVAISPIGRSSR